MTLAGQEDKANTYEVCTNQNIQVMSTNIAKPFRVAIIGASGTYGEEILARAEEIGVEAVVVTRSPQKFKDVKPTTTVVEAELDEEAKLKEAFQGCNRSGPRNLDSGLSEIFIVFQAAVPKLVASKYTTSGVRRPSAL